MLVARAPVNSIVSLLRVIGSKNLYEIAALVFLLVRSAVALLALPWQFGCQLDSASLSGQATPRHS
jgi:hypothetical protein